MRRYVAAGGGFVLAAALLVVVPSTAHAAEPWWTPQATVDAMAVDAQLGHVLLAGDGQLVQLSATTGAQVKSTDDLGAGEMQLAISPDGQTAYTFAEQDRLLQVIDLTTGSKSRRITQDTAGVPGGAERNDRFGAALAVGVDRAGASASVAVTSAGDQTVTVLPAGKGAGAKAFSQETAGVAGGTEAEDAFGEFLRFLRVGSTDGPANLVVGVPGENKAAGSLIVLAPTTRGPSGEGSKVINQDSAGVPGASEKGDYWGWLGAG